MELKNKLKVLRYDHNLTIYDLAFKINIDTYKIASWENGRKVPNAIEAFKLKTIYNINFKDFFTRKEFKE